jgi:hypothetical protein
VAVVEILMAEQMVKAAQAVVAADQIIHLTPVQLTLVVVAVQIVLMEGQALLL